MSPIKNISKTTVSLALFALAAQQLSAANFLDEVTGTLDLSTGSLDSHWGETFTGSVTAPILSGLNFQADGLLSRIGNVNFAGEGVHLFWLDSPKGRIGLFGGAVEDKYLYGLDGLIEGEYFFNRITFGADFGLATIQYAQGAPFIDTHPLNISATASVSYYPIDNLMLQAGYTCAFDNNLGELLFEYETPIKGLSCFADLAVGDNGYNHALFGLRFYFGRNESLLQRHRKDGAQNFLRQILYGIGTYGAEFNRDAQSFFATHPDLGESVAPVYGIQSFSL